jgi:hypothetical protein
MEKVPGQSEHIVRKESYLHSLAYKLRRALMGQAAQTHNQPLHRVNGAETLKHSQTVTPYLGPFAGTPQRPDCINGHSPKLPGAVCPTDESRGVMRPQAKAQTVQSAHPAQKGDTERPVALNSDGLSSCRSSQWAVPLLLIY